MALFAGLLLAAEALGTSGVRKVSARAADPSFDSRGTSERMLRFLRERFSIPDNVKMSLGAFHAAPLPEFYTTTLTLSEGKETKTQDLSVTRDGHYMLQGSIIRLASSGGSAGDGLDAKISQTIREHFKVPEALRVDVGPLRESKLRGFQATTISVGDGIQKQVQEFLVSKDNQYLVQGNLYNLLGDPRLEVIRSISLEDRPYQGGARAPVMIVEYADLECPMCARVHQFLEKELAPKYGNKVKVVFKEFPLVQIHDWSLTAAIGTQCAYAMNPSTFLPLRGMIFENQSMLKAANIRDMLLTYAERVGLDREKFAECLDSKATLPRVEQDLTEGQRLGVASTPTCFINGKPFVGLPSPEAFYKAVDEALAQKGLK
ncbi:MAG TPA: thioredoxin domain-containing protein [Terriglobia bacterium]|nr:thioredoxin domain-containing protein [Terriglobia bacterium]